ncbi:MAG: sodium:calcium antiporter [Acidimicrobiales bacterium]
MPPALWALGLVVGAGWVVWGAETFAEHLAATAHSLRVSAVALAVLLAGAEPEELATGVAASLRHAPSVAVGDVFGANATICLLALGVGALVAPLPFGGTVRRYGIWGLPLGAVAVALSWGGRISRWQGLVLVGLYAAYVAVVWILEGEAPRLGETGELQEVRARTGSSETGEARRGSPETGSSERAPSETGEGRRGSPEVDEESPVGSVRHVGKDGLLVLLGAAAMAGGAVLLVASVRHLATGASLQGRLGLTVVGFATGFEIVVLAWSAARRGAPEVVVAAVVGSFAYNVTMTLGAAALARPLRLADPASFHGPGIVMLVALAFALAASRRRDRLGRGAGLLLLLGYPVFVAVAIVG